MQNKSKNQGLTLVEVAIVLVILGLLIGLGASLIGPLTKRAKIQESRDIVKQAKESFLGYAVKNGYLPQEGTYNNSTPVQAFQDVGTKGRDAWLKPLRYIAANEIEGSSVNVCGINTTSLTITDRGTVHSNIAFIIISGGENFNIQTENTIYEAGTPNIDDFTSDINRQEDYDDIVSYVSLDEIRALRGCPQPLAIISPTVLPDGEEDSYYSYYLQATGGTPPYTWNTWSGFGLTLNSSGQISGTINYNSSSVTGELTESCSSLPSITINTSVRDSAGSPAIPYNGNIIIRPKQLKIITEILPTAYEGTAYNATITATGGRIPYNWSINVSSESPSKPYPWGLTFSGNKISGTPEPGTANTYTVIVTTNRLETGLCTATKHLSLTINPSGSGGGGNCTAYRVWNQTGAMQDFTVSETCRNNRGNNTEITTNTITLNSGGSISRHASTVGNCTSAIVQTLTYADAVAADTNKDCLVNFTLSGFTDR